MKKNHKRISAAVLSLALGFTIAGAPIGAPMAGAQSIISAGMASSVNPGADVSLTINKRLGEIGSTTTAPAGIEFKIEKVNLTNALNTSAGWAEVADLTANNLQGKTTTVIDADPVAAGVNNLTTDANGVASINQATSGFTVGVYRVTEIQSGTYTVAKPFLVTLPFTDANGDWDYSQEVAPKNQEISVTKDVNDAGKTVGDSINYTIKASVPAQDLDRFIITDALPAELDPPLSTGVTVTATGTTPPTLVAPRDYTLSVVDQTITVTFSQDGLTALEGARASDPTLEVNVAFAATIKSLPGNGVIRNDVTVSLPNGGGVTTNPDITTNPGDPKYTGDPTDGSETLLGQLTINKVDNASGPITSDIAKFQLWRCELQSSVLTVTDGPLPGLQGSTQATATKVTEFSTNGDGTDADGIATVYGVQVINWVNNAAPATGDNDKLCIVESEAPSGYVLNPQPQEVTFNAVSTTDPYDMVATVVNIEDTITGQLPATGGKGTMALIAAGVIVAAAGGAAAVRGNRARNS